MFNRRLKQDGFTLIEVLLSLTLLSIILITFLSFFVQNEQFSHKNNQRLVAINLAKQYLSQYLIDSEGRTQDDLLNQTCGWSESGPTYKACTEYPEVTINDEQYKIWTFVQNDNTTSGYFPIIVRVYYGNQFTEAYGYYHPDEGGGSSS